MKNTPAPSGVFDLLIFVGRFQPFHRGHRAVIEAALERSRHVLVLVGSANSARSVRNPFGYDERQRMIVDSIPSMTVAPHPIPANARIIVRPVGDHLYNDAAWIADVQRAVDDVRTSVLPAGETPRIGIIGHSKDHSSYYLKIFPTYESVDVPGTCGPDGRLVNATDLRDVLFAGGDGTRDAATMLATDVPAPALAHVMQIAATAPLAAVADEYAFARDYRARWAGTPFPPTFVTVDAVVQQSAHVLMVVRKEQPGRGMLALPGGFLTQTESLLDGALRELHEETQIDVPRRVLLGALVGERTFDDPYRSIRGRTITHAFRFDLNEKRLPKVKGGDDAAEARWVPLAHVRPEICFEDHAHIIRAMLGVG